MPLSLPLQNKISQESQQSATYRILKSELGNGYRQYAADGINVKRDTWNIVWNLVTEAERLQLVAAFDAIGGQGDYFTWTPFGETAAKKFMITDAGYSYTTISADVFTVTVTLEQEYR